MCGPLQFCVESANIIFVGTDKRFPEETPARHKRTDDDGELA